MEVQERQSSSVLRIAEKRTFGTIIQVDEDILTYAYSSSLSLKETSVL